MSEKISIRNVVKFAGAYIALEIGSGFATGQEIIQFFTSYGAMGIGGICIGMVLYSMVGGKLMAFGYSLRNTENLRPYRIICGKKIGIIYEIMVIIYLFAMLAVMISGTGATLHEYYGISHTAGCLFMTFLVFITFVCGLEKMVDIVGFIGPVIILFTVFVSAMTLAGCDNLNIMAVSSEHGIKWALSGLLYVSYNIFGAVAFLMALGSRANSGKEAAIGGITGGLVLMLTVFILNAALLAQWGDIVGKAVPVLYLAHKVAPLVGTLFAIIILLGIYSTAAPGLWTICSGIGGGRKSSFVMSALISADAFLLGQFPFQRLVAVIYPLAGYLSLILLIFVLRIKRE